MPEQSDSTVTTRLEVMIAQRVEYLKGIPIPVDRMPALGAQQWHERISALLGPESSERTTLDLDEAVLAFVSALAHFAVADGRGWKSDDRTS